MKKQIIILALFLLFLIQTACIGFLMNEKVKRGKELRSNETLIDCLENENMRLEASHQITETIYSIDTIYSTDTIYSVEYIPLPDKFKIRTGMALRLLQNYHETK